MSSDAAHAATLCAHLIEAGLSQPFALYATRKQAQYLCGTCLVSTVERRLAMPNQQPASIAESISFQHCDHPGSHDRACWRCLSAVQAALTAAWAKATFQDKPLANRLLRVVQLLNRHYDPAHNVPRMSISPRYRDTQGAEAQPRITTEQIQEQRRREKIEQRNAQIRQQRGFPATSALTKQGAQPERITVVSPAA